MKAVVRQSYPTTSQLIMRKKCGCGRPMGPTGECVECRRKRLGTQTKLSVNQPGDRYEQEADRMADMVMRMPEPHLQRQVELEEDEDAIQLKPLAEKITPMVQREVEAEGGGFCIQCAICPESQIPPEHRFTSDDDATEISASAPHVLHGGGFPLPRAERSFFESRFGCDFSTVRIHADTKAAATAERLHARAFTHGQIIFFGQGQYRRRSHPGRRLIAHELVHTLQQRRIPFRIQRACDSLKTVAEESVAGPGRCSRRNPVDCCPEEDTGCKKLSTAEGAHRRALAKLERVIGRLDAAPGIEKGDDAESASLPGRAAERYLGIDTTVRRRRGRRAVREKKRIDEAIRPVRETLGLILARMRGPAKPARKQTPSEQQHHHSRSRNEASPLFEPSSEIPPPGSPSRTSPPQVGSSPIPGFDRLVPGGPLGLTSEQLKFFGKPEACNSTDYQIMCGVKPCEGRCSDAYAFFRPSIKRIVLCDSFFYDRSPLQQEATIIHEVAHSVLHPDKLDIYNTSRLFPVLSKVERSSGQVASIDNPDSLAAFVLLGGAELNKNEMPHHVIAKVERALPEPAEDSFENPPLIRRKAERQKAQFNLARGIVDEKIREASKLTVRLANNIGSARRWALLNDGDKATLALLRGDTGIEQASDCNHTRFPGLARGRCPWADLNASPTADDIRIVKAIWKNLDTLRSSSARRLTVDMNAASLHWDANVDRLSLTKKFFETSDEERITLLAGMVVASNPKIGRFAPDYLGLLDVFSIL